MLWIPTYFNVSFSLSSGEILHIAFQIADALAALHKKGICMGILNSDSILVPGGTRNGTLNVRITQYAISHISNSGCDIQGGLLLGFCVAPEQLFDSSTHHDTTFKADVWALGVVLLEMATGVLLRDVWSLKQYMNILRCSMSRTEKNSLLAPVLKALQSASNGSRNFTELDTELINIIEKCLSLSPSQRPSVDEILEHFHNERHIDAAHFESVECLSIVVLSLVVEDLRMFGNDEARKFCVKSEVVMLSDKNVREKLSSVPSMDIFLQSFLARPDSVNNHEENLSVIVKEKDMVYQASRMRVITHLLNSRFYKLPIFLSSITSDVPPMRRADVWCALLNVRSSDQWTFFLCDTLAVHVSDRQLDVDIPRCHQYEELMTSPAAHYGLRRLLKAWLVSNPQYVYWQGCDSLAAPFLLLNFNRLPVALACFTAFIKKYLNNFFLKDNSAIIQEQLAVFNHLLAFVDAKLYTRLASMDFYPELFAIPWFLTCFAHVLPIHKLFHVWDQLLQRDSSFPLFIGLAILRQLRQTLVEASFNDAILLFSDLPDLSMEVVVADSISYYDRVPPSCAFRSHAVHSESNDPPPRGLPCSLQSVSYKELKKWHCPRISTEEFAWRVSDQLIVAIDIRSQIEFGRGCVLRSISYPNVNDLSLLNIAEPLRVAQRNQHPICIIGGKDVELARKFTADLVFMGIDGVCVLDGGFEAIRHDTSLIHVPH
ncbi:TBC domain protein [Oesophagostomum dentatum]|uniref:TBC domain protein n=1 Tax=Oesophagostomum dentatum TaxID=61180 RepID=A0A0B1TUR8_OESDE|nr:TBC domain protein [Oesophagostomum dentatum]